MFGLTSLLRVSLAILAILSGSESISTTILQPIKSTGTEIGLIFIPGANMKPEQYAKTAHAIQEATDLRVWVALTGDYTYSVVSADEMSDAVEDAIRELKTAGMTSSRYVGVGHGWGGHYLQDYAKDDSELKAVVLMGSTISRDTQLSDFPVPVLTLAAELDGVTRITRVAVEFEKLTSNTTSFFQGIYRTPVIYIEGANHAQFASGGLKTQFKAADLIASASEGQTHLLVGKYINAFLTVTFGSNDTKIDGGLNQLFEAFLKSVNKFQPFLDVRDLDTDGEESMWTVLAQEYFADEYADRVAVSNEIFENPWFFGKEASVSFNNDDMIIGTVSLVHEKKKYDKPEWQMEMESPLEIDMKLVSKDAIWKAIGTQKSLRSKPNTCKSLNQLALLLALSASTEEARARYYARGRPIIFEDDAMRSGSILWSPSSLQMWDDKSGLHVRAIALVTDSDHYCKVMSPYRAMEWVNVDSLRVE